jgi:hypothetical protein
VTPHYYMYYIAIEFFVVVYPLALVAMLMKPILKEVLKPIEKEVEEIEKEIERATG